MEKIFCVSLNIKKPHPNTILVLFYSYFLFEEQEISVDNLISSISQLNTCSG